MKRGSKLEAGESGDRGSLGRRLASYTLPLLDETEYVREKKEMRHTHKEGERNELENCRSWASMRGQAERQSMKHVD